jgi:alpha-methylacyl-CoA racemase
MGPLDGIKVLEFSGIGPGPYCGMLLADLGADVIRLSRLNEKGTHNKFDIHNRSKRTIVADLKNPKAIKEIEKLIKEMDVLFEGFRPGVMEKLGLGPDSCLQLNNSLVYGRMTGWGQDGSMSNQAGHDINYISLSGALNAIGDKNSNPSIPLNLIGDYGGGGMMLAMGILAGVISSSKTGKGQVIDSAMIDGSLSLMSFFYSLKQMGLWKDKRKSNLLDGAAHFYDTYECSDSKYIAVGSIEPQFYKILLDKLDLTDPRFKNQMNQSMWKELKEIIACKIKSQSRDHWVKIFADTDGCVTPVLNMEEAQEHEHNISRESFINLEGFNQPAPAPRFSNDTLSVKHNAKEIGSDIDNICNEFNLDKEAFS